MVSEPFRLAWRAWLAVALTVVVVLVGGTLATIDLFDCRELLPWMADRPAWLEVVTGTLGAAIIPFVISLLWGRQWRAGVIAGVALALLFHVTVAVAIVFAVFAALDAAGEGQVGRALRWGGAAVGATLAIVGARHLGLLTHAAGASHAGAGSLARPPSGDPFLEK